MSVFWYLVGSDEGLDSQMILHQLLRVGLSADQRGQLRSRQTQRRLVGGAGGRAGVGVTEKHVPRLERRKVRGQTGRMGGDF